MPNRPRRAIWMVALLALIALGAILAAYPRIERFYLRQAGAEDAATLRLATEVLRGALERTQALPALIADRPILPQLLAEPDNEGIVPFANELLRQSALSLDVSDIYVLDTEGRTVAASNYRTEHSFVGANFSYRPYFVDAMGAGLGRFHALGTQSGQRGYFFASPVIEDTQVIGVVVVKLRIDGFEEAWAQSGSTLIVRDVNNVIFMSDREEWRFRRTAPIQDWVMSQIARTRQYPVSMLTRLEMETAPLDPDVGFGLEVARIGRESFVSQTSLIAAASWRVSILTPTGPAVQRAWTAVLLLSLVVIMVALVLATVLARRARLVERLSAERSLATLLEARVAERTTELKTEVEERRATEARLRKTQAELVQAGKLAALGQMSAALSHEFNQPLAAVKSYAENARTFLDRGRMEDAQRNIERISGLADRMASISKHLRNFARRPGEKTGPVPLGPVIDDALELMAPRLRGVDIRYTPPETEIWVRGGRVRLQQVVVNLLGNALDAMAEVEAPQIDIALRGGASPEIAVRDIGPGLSEEALAQAFDPFFTTKEPGQGLGLGLSISFNIIGDFGGRLWAENHPDGGAIFRVTLESATPEAQEHAAQ
ncbi:sensor histidine kinase [Gymnodinialimonas ceratoperidinii]|uniref:C4-dicarboxylate transport sensor protein DctB n=2 Tax=Gymnodinialimonas ceratoperidinii TaxID=2856823 RepID=A0A8F6YEB9_9RHOB|nr:sensor histidine kinase [Gymnodinialimonas ceratoperidinii]